MFGSEVTRCLPVQQHSLVARCATYLRLHHNVPNPPFYHGYNFKNLHAYFVHQTMCFASILQFMSYVFFIQRTCSGFKQDCRNYFMPEIV